MELSIVITTRNRKDDLIRCVRSVDNADLREVSWELIIIDDASSDGSEVLEIGDLGVSSGKIVHNMSQQMMVKSRNIGVKNSTGKYVLFIDDDNIVDEKMIDILVDFAEKNNEYGIVGPSMYYLNTRKKYLDFQKINLFTGKTSGIIDKTERKICDSDGIPNAFLIKREVFDAGGLFDEKLIQTFTEPDFAFSARKCGYKCGIVKKAKIYHDVSANDGLKARALGGQYTQKAYCLMRNRTVIISRYGSILQKSMYLIFFSWFWPLAYSILMLREKRFDLIKLYWKGFFDG
ncbi:MAG: glycosyltransferase, partial [Candidatus Moraniibacteriota bacterium]